MIKITTWADTQTLPDLKTFVQDQFQFLCKVYTEDQTIPMEQFSLAEYGEICIVENYQEVAEELFQFVEIYSLDSSTIYLAMTVPNNDVAIDYLIPKDILTPSEIALLEEQL